MPINREVSISYRGPRPQAWALSLVVFLSTAAWMWWLCGQRLFLLTDEGMYLEGAVRILDGQAPYRDFFCLTGPGTDLILATLFRLFGQSLESARLLLVADYGFAAAAVFLLSAQRVGRAGAILAVLFFVFVGTVDPNARSVNHRLDSATLALAAIVAAVFVQQAQSRIAGFAAGFFAAAAAWTTPTTGLVLVAIAAWTLYRRQGRRDFGPMALGAAACSLAVAAWLASRGALFPLFRQFAWNASHYGGANQVTFGRVHGGYGGIFADASGAEAVFHAIILAAFIVPMALPFVVYGGWAVRWIRSGASRSAGQDTFLFLMAASFALLLSTYPRWDLTHLVYISPLYYVLAAWLLYEVLGRTTKLIIFGLVIFYSFIFGFQAVSARRALTPLTTPVGTILGSADDLRVVRSLTQNVKPGETAFAYPYLVMFCFLTQGRNPTFFPYMQPGLMDESDETALLGQLQRNPPRWMLYSDIPPDAILRMWPSTDPKRLRFDAVEKFIHANYHRVDAVHHPGVDVQILRHGAQTGEAPPAKRP
jgi:hypothetical protein